MGQYSLPRGEYKRRKKAGTLYQEVKKTKKKDTEITTDIFGAINESNLHAVKTLLKNDESLINSQDSEGRSPLMLSVVSGPDEITKFLVSKGANVNDKLATGETPLMIAAVNKNLDLVKVFDSKEADVNAKEKTQGARVLHRAAAGGDAEIIKLLLSKGADFEKKCKKGWTPLHVAASEGHVDVVKILIEKGASKNAKAKDGTTPVEAADKSSSGNRKAVLDFLNSVD
ncbi:MAG: ankyrin repeat domain-containing protein [Planctomycetota bacterium]|jgi:ankyrin repeat protein